MVRQMLARIQKDHANENKFIQAGVRIPHTLSRFEAVFRVVAYKKGHDGLWGFCGYCLYKKYSIYLRRGRSTIINTKRKGNNHA